MSCMFFSFVLVYLYVSQCTLTWNNGYVVRHEFKQKNQNRKIKSRLTKLDLRSLFCRWQREDIIEVFKILNSH